MNLIFFFRLVSFFRRRSRDPLTFHTGTDFTGEVRNPRLTQNPTRRLRRTQSLRTATESPMGAWLETMQFGRRAPLMTRLPLHFRPRLAPWAQVMQSLELRPASPAPPSARPVQPESTLTVLPFPLRSWTASSLHQAQQEAAMVAQVLPLPQP